MNSIAKKIMVFSLAGIMQLGIGASAIEASPLQIESSQQIVQLHGKHHGHHKHHHHDSSCHHDGDGSFVEGVIVGAVVGAVVASNS